MQMVAFITTAQLSSVEHADGRYHTTGWLRMELLLTFRTNMITMWTYTDMFVRKTKKFTRRATIQTLA